MAAAWNSIKSHKFHMTNKMINCLAKAQRQSIMMNDAYSCHISDNSNICVWEKKENKQLNRYKLLSSE